MRKKNVLEKKCHKDIYIVTNLKSHIIYKVVNKAIFNVSK